jgi:hypothetical protein
MLNLVKLADEAGKQQPDVSHKHAREWCGLADEAYNCRGSVATSVGHPLSNKKNFVTGDDSQKSAL